MGAAARAASARCIALVPAARPTSDVDSPSHSSASTFSPSAADAADLKGTHRAFRRAMDAANRRHLVIHGPTRPTSSDPRVLVVASASDPSLRPPAHQTAACPTRYEPLGSQVLLDRSHSHVELADVLPKGVEDLVRSDDVENNC